MKFQCPLHTEYTCYDGLNSIHVRRLDKSMEVNPEFWNFVHHTFCCRTFLSDSKDRVAGVLSTSRIKVMVKVFKGLKAILEASNGTIDRIFFEPIKKNIQFR